MQEFAKYVRFDRRILIVGFGAVGQGSLPLILRHIDVRPDHVKIRTAHEDGHGIAREYGIHFTVDPILPDNYAAILDRELREGDFLLNAAIDVSSLALIQYCLRRGVIYLDACIEPWAGGHTDASVNPARRSNYAYREAALALRNEFPQASTAVLMHGANPGLVSHLVKQALLNLARDTGAEIDPPTTRDAWAQLARRLGVKVIQIAERDHQTGRRRKGPGEFVNTWSCEAFALESLQPAELGWGTHERHLPADGRRFEFGCGSSLYLDRPGASTRVRSWTPDEGPFHGFLISHGESHSIADYLTVREAGSAVYRPTCYYAYHPSDDAVLSMFEFVGRNYRMPTTTRLLRDDIETGVDELGVLLMGHAKGAYWFGSQLSIEEARALCPHNNATTLQVNSAVLGAMIWAMQHPRRGVVEPDDLDYRAVLDIAKPYLGRLVGVYSDWTPLEGRGRLYDEDVDRSDPWQFTNFRVT